VSEKVIQAAKDGAVEAMAGLLSEGADVNEQDEQGWTPLNWAAGRGDVAAVELLLAQGADVALTGRDRRTPLMIAKAAGHREVAAILTEAEKRAGTWVDPRATRPYCRAYYLRDLRRFPAWSESRLNWREPASGNNGAEASLTDDDIVYLHQDFTVTKSMWHGESSIFTSGAPEWKEFCENDLGFAVPEDLL